MSIQYYKITLKGYDHEDPSTHSLQIMVASEAGTVSGMLLSSTTDAVEKLPEGEQVRPEDIYVHFTQENRRAAQKLCQDIVNARLIQYAATLTAEQLDDKFNPEGDGEHPVLDQDKWINAVEGGTTVFGYWDWVRDQCRAAVTALSGTRTPAPNAATPQKAPIRTSMVEATIAGYDGESDDTDDLVLWIAMDDNSTTTLELLQEEYRGRLISIVPMSSEYNFETLPADNIDFHFTARSIYLQYQTLDQIIESRILDHDVELTAEQLDEKYNPEGNGEHPLLRKTNWIDAVKKEDTRSGYWDWVAEAVYDNHRRLSAKPARMPDSISP